MTPSQVRELVKTGHDWLPSIPASWALVPAKALFTERGEASTNEDQHLTPSQKFGVVTQAEYMEITGTRVVLNLTGSDNMKRVRPGDFVIHLRSFQGGIERSAIPGKVSLAYTVLTPRPGVEGQYFRWLLKSDRYIQALRVTVNQLRDGQSIRYQDFSKIHLPLPPIKEQRAIATFLDRETAQIDQLIERQNALIERLRERRSATITYFATRGLHPEVEFRDSGSPYLGQVPSHWTVSHFGLEMAINAGLVDPTVASWSDAVMIAPNHIESGTGRILGRETAEEQGAESGKYTVGAGQLIYSKIRPALNKVTVAREDCLCSADMYGLTSRKGDSHRYLMYYMLSSPFHSFASEMSARVKMPKINREELGAAPWLRPPQPEQREIADHLDRETAKIDALITKAGRHVELAKERRSALITAAVTGQIDVGVA